jgi:hypothetical protein
MNFGIEIALIIFYFVVISLIIQRHSFFKLPALPKNFLLGVFSLKVLAGIILAIIYTKYYPNRNEADIFKYFDDSKYMFDALNEKPEDFFRMLFGNYGGDDHYYMHKYYFEMNNWYREFEGETFNDTHTIIRFNAFLRIFSFGVYHVHTIIVCFLSLIGMVAIYKAFESAFKGKELLMAAAIFLLPSVLFWGSGVLKEGLLIFGLGLLIHCCFELFKGNYKWLYFLIAALVFFLLLFLKVYALLLLLPCLVAYYINQKRGIKIQILTYIICFVFSGIIALNFSIVKDDFNVLEILTAKQHDFINHAAELDSKSRLEIEPLEPNLISFAINSPQSFFITFFRPFFFESKNPMMILAGLENLLILVLLIVSIIKRDKMNYEQKNLFYFLLTYAILMFTLVGMITPVMGAMVRYKVPALGMMVAGIILLGNWKLLLNNYPKLKKRLKIEG